MNVGWWCWGGCCCCRRSGCHRRVMSTTIVQIVMMMMMMINRRLMLCWDGTGANYCWIICNTGGGSIYTRWRMLHMNIACIWYGIHLGTVCGNCIHYIIWMHLYAQVVRYEKSVWNESTELATSVVFFLSFYTPQPKRIYDDRLTNRPTNNNEKKITSLW